MSKVCPACLREQMQGLLCHACTSLIERDLAAVPELVAELDTTLTRQDRIRPGARGGLTSEMTPWRQDASITLSTLTNTLTVWAGDLCADQWTAGVGQHPAHAAAGYLLLEMTAIRRHPAAAELLDEITYAVEQARREVDRTARRFPVGPCPERDDDTDCPGVVWAFLPVEDTRPAVLECRANPEHRWTAVQWIRVGPRIMRKIEQRKRAS